MGPWRRSICREGDALSVRRLLIALIAAMLVLGSLSRTAAARELTLERPGERDFVLDLADLMDVGAEGVVKDRCDKLLTEKVIPVIVVTINSMADHGGGGMSIESFATQLFNQWGIGHPELNDQEWNAGVLLLVSKNDRKARIELGGGWGRDKDALCKRIMDEQIVARFKEGNFQGGIVAGVAALDDMARGKPLPARKRPLSHYLMIIGLLALTIFTIVSLIKSGASGWAWAFWAVVFTILWTVMISAMRSRGGGGFSGGSFGGGSSGGGGASGSW